MPRVNLTDRTTAVMDTEAYRQWGGGHGIGSAVFFDLVKDKTVSGLDPANVMTIMTSPLTGTLAFGAGARIELQAIGLQAYPLPWFTRSSVGGRFGAMLKFAGWDGIVIEGVSDTPVWIDIRDDDVRIRDCAELSLWGTDTMQCQQAIWKYVAGNSCYGDWIMPLTGSGSRTTQRPAVLAIGPAGERLVRISSIIHDSGNASGQGGFGAVWGSKNLKAISVIGTGDIAVADPKALFEARQWAIENFTFPLETIDAMKSMWATMPSNLRSFPVPLIFWKKPPQLRPQACFGCQAGCRCRYADAIGNDSSCKESGIYQFYKLRHVAANAVGNVIALFDAAGKKGTPVLDELYDRILPTTQRQAADIVQRYGINAGEFEKGIPYLRDLNKMGVMGPGMEIDTDLPFHKLGQIEFVERLVEIIVNREGIGEDIAEGFTRAAERWGRLDKDLKTGILNCSYWGLPMHYDPRVSLEWGYGTILSDRDINEHCFNPLYMIPMITTFMGTGQPLHAEDFARLYTDRMLPFQNDPRMVDFSDDNMYSESVAKLVAWHRRYTRFWKHSALFCDLQYPDFFNWAAKGYHGITGEGEPRFFNAVTGAEMSFAEGIELGRKIWNLDNAIWTLQGRHRDMVKFSDYIYDTPSPWWGTFYCPAYTNGAWEYVPIGKRSLDREKFEQFKTIYYQLEGWDTTTGWPMRSTLESLGLGYVADELERNGKLGKDVERVS